MKALILCLLAALAAVRGGAQAPLSLDTSFRCTRFFTGELVDILPLDDGSVVASAFNTTVDGCCAQPFRRWFRVLSNGAIDESWPGIALGGQIHPFGAYYYMSGAQLPGRCYLANGAPDYGYSVGAANNPHPDLLFGNGGNIHVQADEKVLITGDHHIGEQWGSNAPGYYSLLRLNTDATLDSTYHFRKTDGVIWNIVPTTQGRFLLSGVYNTYEGQPQGRILRIWPDGSLDSTFHTTIIRGYASCLVEQPNGRILAGGYWVLPNDPDTMHLIRLMPDGALDTTFHNHTEYGRLPTLSFGAFGYRVLDLLPLADGTMVVGGSFTHIDGQQRRGIALLDSTGHLLSTALNGEGALRTHDVNSTYMYSGINSIKQAPDGSIILAGVFKGFDDGTVRDSSLTFIVRLHGLSTGMAERARPVWEVRVWPNPGREMLQVEASTKGRMEVRVLDATGRAVLAAANTNGTLALNSAGLSHGVYLVEVQAAGGRQTVKWVKQ